MSDVQPRQFGSAIQWNSASVDTSPESWGKQFGGAEDPLRALGEEQREWANQARERMLEPSEGSNHREAVSEAVAYTFPWTTPGEGCAGPSCDILVHSDTPVAGPSENVSDSLQTFPDSGIYGNCFLVHDDTNESLNSSINDYTLPEAWLSGPQASSTSVETQPDPFLGLVGNTGHPSSETSGITIGLPMHGAIENDIAGSLYGGIAWDFAARPYEALGPLQWNSEVYSCSTSQDGPSTSEYNAPPAFLQGSSAAHQVLLSSERSRLAESAFSTEHVPPQTNPTSSTSAMASGIPQCLSIFPQVRDISNKGKNTNAEENPLSPTSLDAPTLQSEHGDDPQPSVEEQQVEPNEVLPIIPRPSKVTASLPCGFCVQKFSDLNSRNKHERLHSRTRDNQPSCPGCKKKLARLDAVVRHVRKRYEKDRTNNCVVVALRRGWRYKVRGTGRHLLPGQGLA